MLDTFLNLSIITNTFTLIIQTEIAWRDLVRCNSAPRVKWRTMTHCRSRCVQRQLVRSMTWTSNNRIIVCNAYSWNHYGDVIMGAIASRITSLTIVYSAVYSDADQRKHQSSASLAFVWGIHREPVNSPHKWSVTRKMFPFDDVIMIKIHAQSSVFKISWSLLIRDQLIIIQLWLEWWLGVEQAKNGYVTRTDDMFTDTYT